MRAFVVASIFPSRDDLPTHHGDREIVYDDVIVTGVPRREGPTVWLIDKGGKNPVPLGGWVEPSPQPTEFDHYKAFAEAKPVIETKPPPPLPQPTPEPQPSSPRHRVRCTIRPPSPEKDDPGQIIEGAYSLSGNMLRVYDETSRLIGMDTLRPGDDVVHAARKILREKHGRHGGFYDPIPYRRPTVF